MSAIKLLSTLAVMGAMRDLARRFEAETGAAIQADFSPTVALLERLRAGETADAAILTAQGVEELIAEGVLRPGSRMDVALSFVGLAVKAGAPRPPIRSVAELTDSLLAARCVAYSRIGASGLYFAALLQRLGIADAVNARALVVPSGFTAERLVSGEADLAVQQVSELMVVPGIEVIGPLPREVQTVATFSAGLLTDRPEAAALLRFLAGPKAAAALRASGLEPAGNPANG
ncbi:substrate-binding domain-containing protein [Rhodopila sp.]|jgi:molybdate transport system substrate-binding protein|uniref:substrate-binding domain-containing protein n=1 Tax=Rhodopila sp. TaxID=2480087 RepID=UPI002C9606C4|nr:substrate-binding domain-containing protein [Rhodopila sp.]HVZ09796.1 substrate-binding domain-containing protein [Rhodopila sp.]